MKKAILLVDAKNCNFLIVSRNSNWYLPTLDKIDDINKVSEKFYKKYNLNISNVSLVSEGKYLVIKCNLISEIFDEKKFAKGVLNEICSIINDKLQKEIISDILVNIEYIIKTFEKEIDYDFGISYKIGLALAKIQYWASN